MELKRGNIVFSHNKKYKGKAWYWIRTFNTSLIFPSFVVSWIYDINAMVVNYKPDPSLPYLIDSGTMRIASGKDKRKLIKSILDVAHIETKKKT